MPIAIIGSGRSGTSMVTRMLNLCGVYLGKTSDLRCAGEWNEKGFWEHAGIHAINDRLLDVVGGSYEAPPMLAKGWEHSPVLDVLYHEARALIAREFHGRGEWAWKLPSATFTLPFWRRVAPDLKVVICIRSPLDFAASIQEYGFFSREHALTIWQLYNFAALRDTLPNERIFTCYKDYFPDYAPALHALLDRLGIARPAPGSEVDRAIAQFHEPGLQHHMTDLSEVVGDNTIPYLARELFLEMLTAMDGDGELPIMKHVDAYMPLLHQAVVGDNAVRMSSERMRKYLTVVERRAARSAELEQILASDTHRLASRVCSFLIRYPVIEMLRRPVQVPAFGFRSAPRVTQTLVDA